MRIANANPLSNRIIGAQNPAGGRNTFRDRIIQERLQDRKREMRIRERENEWIVEINQKMAHIKACRDMGIDSQKLKLAALQDRIDRIYESRTEREALAAEREMMRTKALLEESKHVNEQQSKQNDLPKDPEEAEEERQRASIKSMTRIAAIQDNISRLSRTRAALAGEAGHIRRAIESENSNYTKTGAVPNLIHTGERFIIGVQSGYGNPNDFKNTHLNRLNLALTNLDASINHAVSSMYRESAKLQDSQLMLHRQQAEEDEDKTVGVDAEL